MLSSSYKKKCSNFHKKLTEPLQLRVGVSVPSLTIVKGQSILRLGMMGVKYVFVFKYADFVYLYLYLYLNNYSVLYLYLVYLIKYSFRYTFKNILI